uniref:gamma-glutamylcyclotransferase n=1 Tax=Globodera rostochiensis TaxID=31243 RepID=A0A914H8M4_GLORO
MAYSNGIKSDGKFYYFAYGSNLLKERIQVQIKEAEFVAIGVLDNYELAFFDHYDRWHSAVATIEEKIGSSVWGCIWSVPNSFAQELDNQEYCYDKIKVFVQPRLSTIGHFNSQLTGSAPIECHTYQYSNPDRKQDLPSPQYKYVIVTGAEEHGLPAEYIEWLRNNFPDNGYNGTVEVELKALANMPKPPQKIDTESDGKFYYFAYGSNLLEERIQVQIKEAEFVAIGVLDNYELAFFDHYDRWHSAVATIEEKIGSSVWGCIWSVPNSFAQELDNQEYCYDKIKVFVQPRLSTIGHFNSQLTGSAPIECHTYQYSNPDRKQDLPSPQYKYVIVTGAEEHGLPAEYIEWLRNNFPDNGYNGTVEVELKALANMPKPPQKIDTESDGKFYYFAYGSNLLEERIQVQIKEAEFVAIGVLDNYELAFFDHYDRWHSAVATIEEKIGSSVWGCIWSVPNSFAQELDNQEYFFVQPRLSTIGHFNSQLTGSAPIECHTYQYSNPDRKQDLPSPQYKYVIVTGAEEHGLPAEYIEWLRNNFPDNGYNGTVEVELKALANMPKPPQKIDTESDGKFYYFAYGSNLLEERIQVQIKEAEFVAIGVLDNYELAFFDHYDRWHSAVATIEEKIGSSVWGCIWSVPNSFAQELDNQEYFFVQPRLSTIGHFNSQLTGSAPIECHTYQYSNPDRKQDLPSPQYKYVIVTGAEEHGLPAEYIEWLRNNFPDNEYNGTVEVALKALEKMPKPPQKMQTDLDRTEKS